MSARARSRTHSRVARVNNRGVLCFDVHSTDDQAYFHRSPRTPNLSSPSTSKSVPWNMLGRCNFIPPTYFQTRNSVSLKLTTSLPRNISDRSSFRHSDGCDACLCNIVAVSGMAIEFSLKWPQEGAASLFEKATGVQAVSLTLSSTE